LQIILFDHLRDQWNLLSAMHGVWNEGEFLVACQVLPQSSPRCSR
jgi:hypothetical protein